VTESWKARQAARHEQEKRQAYEGGDKYRDRNGGSPHVAPALVLSVLLPRSRSGSL
jgi:hypothetical protein